MRRGPILWILVGIPLVAFIAWIGVNTEWDDVKVPLPPTGEAARNPFYVVQKFADTLGVHTTWDRYFITPPKTDAVIVLANWHWNLSTRRRDALEHWVENGGRLVVDATMSGSEDEFATWSGVNHEYPEDPETDEQSSDESDADDILSPKDAAPKPGNQQCRTFIEERNGVVTPPSPGEADLVLCNVNRYSFLKTAKTPQWALREASGIKVMRVAVGRGSVTVINAAPFHHKELFEADHGRLFVAASQLRRGDEVHFLSEGEHPSLLALIWFQGGPVVVLSFALIALLLWRGGVRFGPLAAPPLLARRSLAEQIRGTGQFALRHGSGAALHTATVRALEEAAQRRINGYARLSARDRVDALSRLVNLDRNAMWTAMFEANPESRSQQDLRRMLALLERARRNTVVALDQRSQ
jgi:Domain of unknown function (DUF4350)